MVTLMLLQHNITQVLQDGAVSICDAAINHLVIQHTLTPETLDTRMGSQLSEVLDWLS
jgi:hypothetical protein